MLNTDNRQLLLSSLRPPMGYRFDRGVGTTFTLDLFSLMVAPLALTLVDFDGLDSALKDPLILMESLRRVASRLIIFCQAGRISVPTKQNLLFHYLEDQVIEVNKKGGVFHPKVWILRYLADGLPPLYRLLVLSRNLTFDRSWDLMLQLEGEVDEGRSKGLGYNGPLADLLAQLPKLALREVKTETREELAALELEIRRVRWKIPEPFEGDPEFFPIGISRYKSLDLGFIGQRLLVISPFVDERRLSILAQKGAGHVLISRPESLAGLSSATLNRFKEVYILQDPVEEIPEDTTITVEEVEQAESAQTDLSGLHAKLIVWEKGVDAGWFIGSANATEKGFGGGNVEFIVGLNGRRNRIGVNTVLGLSGEKTDFPFSALLKPYNPNESTESDSAQDEAEKLAEQVLSWLINAQMQLAIQQGESGYDLEISVVFSGKAPKGNYDVSCWPINLPPSSLQNLSLVEQSARVTFTNLSLLALTRFMAFQITVTLDKIQAQLSFVATLPVTGMPEGRDERVVSEIISNQSQFLRYLRLLLGQDGGSVTGDGLLGINLEQFSIINPTKWATDNLDLLENLVRTISRAPERIDRIAEIVEELLRTPEGMQALPPEFLNLWNTIAAWRAENNLEEEATRGQ